MIRTALAAVPAFFLVAALAGQANSTIRVPAGGDLQDALNRARPGDTILLQRGATYVGNFVLPARDEGGRVITLRTTGDAGFPLERERKVDIVKQYYDRIQAMKDAIVGLEPIDDHVADHGLPGRGGQAT